MIDTIPKNVTLKDIALRCGVTPTLVSAVLNGRSGTISCSPEKRALIEQTAVEMNYRANFFARSIRNRKIPIIGMLLHLDEAEVERGVGRFVNSCLTDMTLLLNRRKFEVLFIPYSREDEQIERLTNLLRAGLLGGIVTNIIPDSHRRICALLQRTGMPYMVLGYPFVDEIYCVYPVTRTLDEAFIGLARQRGFRRCVMAVDDNSSAIAFREYPFIDDFLYRTPLLDPEQCRREADEIFFVLSGALTLNNLRKANFPLSHYILWENETFRHMVPPGEPVILDRSTFDSGPVIEYTAHTLCDWIETGRPPERFKIVFDDNANNFTFYPDGLPP